MGRGTSKAGGGSASRQIDYKTFMSLNDEAKDEVINNLIATVTVPKGIKDTPTMRVVVGLGLGGAPTMVTDQQLDSMKGKDLYRAITDEKLMSGGKGKSSDEILKEFTTAKYSSMSDSFGSSEGRGYYFAKQLNGASLWATDGGKVDPSNKIMRAKVQPNAKLLNMDKLFTGSKVRQEYTSDRHFHETITRKVPPWDGVSIWAIKKGYQGANATDSGTGKSEMVIFDRTILAVSKTTKSLPSNYKGGDKVSWKKL